MTPLRRLPFAVLAAFLSLALVGCGGSKPAGIDGTPSTKDGTPTTGASPTASEGTKKPGGTGPSAGTSPAPTKKGSTGTTNTNSLAPRAGTYTYAQSGTTVRGEAYPNRGTLIVGSGKANNGGVEQEQTRHTLSSGDGERFVYGFYDDHVAVLKAFRSGQWCTLDPPLTVLKLPLKTGETWKGHSECVVSGITVTSDFSATVLRKETRRVGGTDLETFVLSTTLTTAVGIYGSATEKATTWLSPKYKLVIRSEQTSESSAGTGHLNEELLSLEPKG